MTHRRYYCTWHADLGYNYKHQKYTKTGIVFKEKVCTKRKLEASRTITAKNQRCIKYMLLTTQSNTNGIVRLHVVYWKIFLQSQSQTTENWMLTNTALSLGTTLQGGSQREACPQLSIWVDF